MFTLRRFSSDGIEMNHIVGDNYTYINRERNPKEFRKEFKAHFKKDYPDDLDEYLADLNETSDDDMTDCYAFVCNPPFYQALWITQKSFIMTDNGKTFANLSYK